MYIYQMKRRKRGREEGKKRERGREEGRKEGREGGREGGKKGGHEQGHGDYRAGSSPGPSMPVLYCPQRPKVCLWEPLAHKCLLIDKMSLTYICKSFSMYRTVSHSLVV